MARHSSTITRSAASGARVVLRRVLVGAGLAAAAALAVYLTCAPGPAPPGPVPATATLPAPTAASLASPTATIGCPYAAAPTLAVPTLVALVPGRETLVAQPTPSTLAFAVPAGGFMDLPIPYDGTPETFRQLVNRSTMGGLITSYFDHEFPLYPWVWHGFSFGGSELPAAPTGTSVLAFDGVRLSEDWYTGHPGFDLAPLPEHRQDTPVLAAADGLVESAGVTADGNHVITLRHAVPGLGEFQTIYMHLQDDAAFAATRLRVGTVVTRGERIATMGNTGQSTGVHLHLEVRHDANGDGLFDRQERVDPFGYIPLETSDPWAQDASWTDSIGRPVRHTGIESRYLWIHPLGVAVQVGEGPMEVAPGRGGGEMDVSACLEPGTLSEGTTLLLAWAPDVAPEPERMGTGHGCVVFAQDASGRPAEAFKPPLPVSLAFSAEDIQGVDPTTLAIHLYSPDTGQWVALPTQVDLERGLAQAAFPRPGRCALLGRPVVDRLAPHTLIAVSGAPDAEGFYCEPVTVTLSADDEGEAGLAATRYSLDYGTTWTDYVEPFTVEIEAGAAASVTRPRGAVPEDVLFLEPGERVVLAESEDAAGNREYPPAIARIPMRCPAPEAELTAEPAQITPPCCATLSWDVADADAVLLDEVAVPPAGSREVCPTSTMTYTLRVISRTGSEGVAQATVEVQPVDVAFTIEPAALWCGQSATLAWQVANAREVYLEDQAVEPVGSRDLCLPSSRTLTLRVVPPCGEAITRQVTVSARPLQVALDVSPTQIYACQCSTLSWDVAGASSATLDEKPVQLSGSQQVCPRETHTYALRAASGCCAPAEASATVHVLPEPPLTFTADRTTIKAGEAVTLQWAVDGVQAVYLDGAGVGGHDARTFTPTSSHTYVLRVVWACSEILRTIPVTVQADRDPPVIRVTTGSGFLCGRPIRLEAAVYDASPLASVLVTYRYSGDRLFIGPYQMLGSAPNLYYEIEGKPGVTYAIRATDVYGNVATTEAQTTTCTYILY